MSAIALMARALNLELQRRGIFKFSAQDCEAIMAVVVEKTALVADAAELVTKETERRI